MILLINNYEMIANATKKLAKIMLEQGKTEKEVINALLQFDMFEEQVISIIKAVKVKLR
ncbi:MAG TPA: hypothetical protein PKW80_01070 [Bacteroidales bacterium]|nr:hypothetical protein [Bacteroidales bacterium]